MSLLESLLEDELLAVELKPLREFFVAIRTDGVVGDGTRQNPFDGSNAVTLNKVIRDHRGSGDIIIRFGPGLFRTFGADPLLPSLDPPSFPLRIFSGTKITGAGMFSTTLRLTAISAGIASTHRNFPVLGGDGLVDNVEITDLTIDCDLGNQPITAGTPGEGYALMALKAIELVGRNNRIRRVRVINFGTRTPFFLDGVDQNGTGLPGSAEAFPFYILGEGAVVEDCIFEQPFLGTARETTIMILTGPGALARNNYIDCAFVNPRNGFSTAVTGVSYVGSSPATVTVKTRFPHNVKAGDFIEIKGADLSAYNDR